MSPPGCRISVMKARKALAITARWLFILSVPAFLLTAGIGLMVNSQWLYQYGFDKYDVAQTTGLDSTQLEEAASGLIGYFNSGEETISLTVVKNGQLFTLFNEREVAHLRDVKGLIRLDYWVLLATGVYSLAYAGTSLFRRRKGDRRRLAWSVVGGGGATLGLILVLGLAALIDFDGFFLQFHLLGFANDLWQLDPARDYLIMLFPQGFWFDATMLVALVTVVLAIILAAAAGLYLRASRKELEVQE